MFLVLHLNPKEGEGEGEGGREGGEVMGEYHSFAPLHGYTKEAYKRHEASKSVSGIILVLIVNSSPEGNGRVPS